MVGVVKIFDAIGLRSCFGTFLTGEASGEGHAGGKELAAEQTVCLSLSNLFFWRAHLISQAV